ncbi:peptidyl-tRNA hydrolase Pth2 [Candidatus Borrarchaeum sp.]|jgi:PTH2 family peptidyl-tRNA hydrolase|uniref:peptidyl-tRNA hydrolase Pth2 n=1 Tax=Candidatus Borrarchaeum sp. TaxID=2846742 RepID=UPI00257BE160|nr:peptidyl-tRNA hydrolase Pth2 [Candidatus Borrarchaeum sp.]
MTSATSKAYEYKMVMVIRTDLKMSKGKMIVQACHAAVESSEVAKRENREIWKKWKNGSSKKVALRVESLEELLELYNNTLQLKVSCALIKDAGLTELPPGTTTALGIGPDKSEIIDKITGQLQLI